MDLRILTTADVERLLDGNEDEVLGLVREAYRVHAEGHTSLPHSLFLRFPGDTANRIIALPAFLGGDFDVAGIKWIASFPGNVASGIERASAVIVLNSMQHGYPQVLLEGARISAARTAASAAVAADALHAEEAPEVGLVGTGRINSEIARYLRAVRPGLGRFVCHDLDRERAAAFARKLGDELERPVDVAGSLEEVLERCGLVSFATTATVPHLESLSACRPGSTLLHVSLRDLAPEAILAADNIVDDLDHVCRAETSIHLTEREVGSRGFVRAELGEILGGEKPARPDPEGITVFSPFGLGILDLALAHWTAAEAERRGLGTTVEGFTSA